MQRMLRGVCDMTSDAVLCRFAVTLLDAPGHKDFVPNMIAGAAQADAGLLIVDGSPGGFESGFGEPGGGRAGAGQTREHVHVARSVGIRQLAVVISKLDTCGFAQERFEEVKGRLAPFLSSCGFKDVQWLPASAPTGQNVSTAPTEAALTAWWPAGPTVVDAIDSFEPVARPDGPLPFQPISCARTSPMHPFSECLFSERDFPPFCCQHTRAVAGTQPGAILLWCSPQDSCCLRGWCVCEQRRRAVRPRGAGKPLRMVVADLVAKPSLSGKVGIAGKVHSGAVAIGSALLLLPSNSVATVKSLEVQGVPAQLAVAGDAAEIGLTGVEATDVELGSVACHPEFPVQCTRKIKVRCLPYPVWRAGVP